MQQFPAAFEFNEVMVEVRGGASCAAYVWRPLVGGYSLSLSRTHARVCPAVLAYNSTTLCIGLLWHLPGQL